MSSAAPPPNPNAHLSRSLQVAGSVKDYISFPKRNNYQSLHAALTVGSCEGQVVEVLDRILSSASAGSFLEHTVIILNQARSDHFDDEEGTKEEYVNMIRENLRERHEQGDEMQQLVDESTSGGVGLYEDDRWVIVCRKCIHSTTLVYPQYHLH